MKAPKRPAPAIPVAEIVWERVRTPAMRKIVAGLRQYQAQATARDKRAWRALCKRAMRHGLLRAPAATGGAQ